MRQAASTQVLGDPVISFVKDRIASLYKNLPLAMAGKDEPIHQIRVATRRLRVTLPLVARSPKGKRVRRVERSLRNLARAAALSRDLDVGLALFQSGSGPAGSPEAWRSLRRKLVSARGMARRKMTESLLDFNLSRLRRDLRKAVQKGSVGALPANVRLRLMREEEGKELIERLEGIGTEFDPVALHEVRSAIRRLRYAAELGATLRGSDGGEARLFREAQDLLGEMHDAWVLSQWLGHRAALAQKAGRTSEGTEAGRLVASFEDLSRALHGKFLEWDPIPTLRRALAQVGRSVFVA